MSRIQKLKNLVDQLYQEKRVGRDSWADYLYNHHIYLVADCAQILSERFGCNAELAVAAAMLHDIADAVMGRFDPGHSIESERIARDFLTQSGFSQEEIALIVEDALRHHGCRDVLPMSREGKIMATADAVIHLTSDFYPHALLAHQQEGKTLAQINEWTLAKIERDFYRKIFFDEIREEVRPDYDKSKLLFEKIR